MKDNCSNSQTIEQHEQLIIQLLTMVAVTNRKLTELTTKQEQLEKIVHEPSSQISPRP